MLNLCLHHLWFDCQNNSKLPPISVFWNHSPAATVIFSKWKSDHCTMVPLCLRGKIQIPYRHKEGLSWPGSCLPEHLSYLILCFFLTSTPAHPSLRPQQAYYTSQETPCSLSIADLLKKPFLTPDPPGKVPFSFMNHWISLYPSVKFLALHLLCGSDTTLHCTCEVLFTYPPPPPWIAWGQAQTGAGCFPLYNHVPFTVPGMYQMINR